MSHAGLENAIASAKGLDFTLFLDVPWTISWTNLLLRHYEVHVIVCGLVPKIV